MVPHCTRRPSKNFPQTSSPCGLAFPPAFVSSLHTLPAASKDTFYFCLWVQIHQVPSEINIQKAFTIQHSLPPSKVALSVSDSDLSCCSSSYMEVRGKKESKLHSNTVPHPGEKHEALPLWKVGVGGRFSCKGRSSGNAPLFHLGLIQNLPMAEKFWPSLTFLELHNSNYFQLSIVAKKVFMFV